MSYIIVIQFIGKKRREKLLSNISVILQQLMMLHVSFIFHLNPVYFMASDYMDYTEMGETSPEGSEEWIESYAHDAFDKKIKTNVKMAD